MLENRRLVLISNREPYVRAGSSTDGRFVRTTGGLVTAIEPIMRRFGGVWLAWDPGGDPRAPHRFGLPSDGHGFILRQVPLSRDEVRHYYHGFANRALWPLCHYFVDRCHFEEADWKDYVAVNARFAEAALDEADEDDLVWIHDYHFCLLPKMMRQRRRSQPIAFFLHIPFPAEEVFKILPWREEVLEGILGADLIGVHVSSYVTELLGCCERLLGAKVDYERGLIHWDGRQVRVGAFPIGIDVEEVEGLATSPAVQAKAARIRRNFGDSRLVIGVDRLDYSKGIPERIAALERLLDLSPDYQRRLCFVQIAVPSRTKVSDYRHLKRQLDELVGRVNGRFGDSSWEPVRYLYRSLSREDLTAYYLAADVAMVTPLRDGMNLVAKEYCASRVDEDGVLVLSEFSGVAEGLSSGAVLVNPFSVEATARALEVALEMPKDQRLTRMRSMRAHVRDTHINVWLRSILEAAGKLRPIRSTQPSMT